MFDHTEGDWDGDRKEKNFVRKLKKLNGWNDLVLLVY